MKIKPAITVFKQALLLAALSIPLAAPAVTYYIDSNAGNDNNNGTSDLSPWQTIGKIQRAGVGPHFLKLQPVS